MYLAVAIVLFAIIFAASSAQQRKKDKMYEEYKSRQRQKTIREYYYAQFYFLGLIQKLIPVFQEYSTHAFQTEVDPLIEGPKASAIRDKWRSEVLRINYRTYTLDQIAICKAREQIVAEGYMPSDPFMKEFYPTYDPWKFPERHRHRLLPEWPMPPWVYHSTHSVENSGYQTDIRDLDEVAEKFGYHNFCDTILHLHYNETTGLVYSNPAAEPGPWEPFREKLLEKTPKYYWRDCLGDTVFFGLQDFQTG